MLEEALEKLPSHEKYKSLDLKVAGERFNGGKLKWSLLPFSSLEPLVRVLEYGAEKYAPHNWKKGLPYTEVCESLLRHTYAFMEGEDIDEESKQKHLGHMMANVMFLSWYEENKKEFDDR